MAVYVDPLMNHGWVLRGRAVPSCHLLTDDLRLDELHAFAARIGLKRAWFQPRSTPHYDLTPKRRSMALAAGAIALDRRKASEICAAWRGRREATHAALCNVIPDRGFAVDHQLHRSG